MAQRKLHADEVSIDISLVRRLLETQHPTLARLRIQPIPLRSTGTVNAVYRLGRLYAEGRGVPKSASRARRWFGLAARMGYAPAERALEKGGRPP